MAPDESDVRRFVEAATDAVAEIEELDGDDWEALQREGVWRRWKASGDRQSDVWLRLGIVDGRLACTGMVVEPIDGDLSARDLRDIRFTELIALAGADGIAFGASGDLTVERGVHRQRTITDKVRITGTLKVTQDDQTLAAEGTVTQPVEPATEQDTAQPVTIHAAPATAHAEALRVTVKPGRVHPGPKGWPPEHFQLVAKLYREALMNRPRSPMKWAAEHWPTSDATMRRWVKRARAFGYLRDDE